MAFYWFKSVIDIKGPKRGKYRVLRGGSLIDNGMNLSSAFRYWLNPDNCSHAIGFRVARDF